MYHPGYAAKRHGDRRGGGRGSGSATCAASSPQPGDVIILLGGRTGRDGCGGATGSSKAHKVESLETCGAEVQKGNPAEERKLQRLFRQRRVTRLIKRCNDFGAGGVSRGHRRAGRRPEHRSGRVCPRKYEGLDGTELAISESQERMAVVVAAEDADAFIGYANAENLEATVVAEVTEEPRLRMTWKGHTIVDISREFLNSNGAEKHARALVTDAKVAPVTFAGETFAEKLRNMAGDLNICSQEGPERAL